MHSRFSVPASPSSSSSRVRQLVDRYERRRHDDDDDDDDGGAAMTEDEVVGSPARSPAPRSPRVGSPVVETHPLRDDPRLRTLLRRLDTQRSLDKRRTFGRWRRTFLERLEEVLEGDDGPLAAAAAACAVADAETRELARGARDVRDRAARGGLSADGATVTSALALHRLCRRVAAADARTNDLLPRKVAEERERGYTKFHVGAALIRRGFDQYASMRDAETSLDDLGSRLDDATHRTPRELFARYAETVRRFRDVMADLRLYGVMMRCVGFEEHDDDDEEEEEERADAGLERRAEGTGGEHYTEHPSEEDEDPLVTLVVRLGGEDAVELTARCGTDTVGDLRRRLAEVRPDHPADATEWTVSGVYWEADDDEILEDAGVEDADAVLAAETRRVLIGVTLLDGRRLEVPLHPAATKRRLRVELERLAGVATREQRLFPRGTDGDADEDALCAEGDDDAVADAGTEWTMWPRRLRVFAETPDGVRHELSLTLEDTVATIKRRVEDAVGIPTRLQCLRVVATSESTETTDDDEQDVVAAESEDTEERIDGFDAAPSEEPTNKDDDGPAIVVHDEDSSAIDSSAVLRDVDDSLDTVMELGVREGTLLRVEVKKVPVTLVTMDGASTTVAVDPTARLSSLRAVVHNAVGIAVDDQNLWRGDVFLADDDARLTDLGVDEGAVVRAEPRRYALRVLLPGGARSEIIVAPDDTTARVQRTIEETTGASVAHAALRFADEDEAEDVDAVVDEDAAVPAPPPADATLRELRVLPGATVRVSSQRSPLTVRTTTGASVRLRADPFAPLRALKAALATRTGTAVANQRLFLDAAELTAPDRALRSHRVVAHSVLVLEPRRVPVRVSAPSVAATDLALSPDDDAAAIKRKAAEITGLAPDTFVVKFEGREIPPRGRAVRDMGLYERDDAPRLLELDPVRAHVTVRSHDASVKVEVDPAERPEDLLKRLMDDARFDVIPDRPYALWCRDVRWATTGHEQEQEQEQEEEQEEQGTEADDDDANNDDKGEEDQATEQDAEADERDDDDDNEQDAANKDQDSPPARPTTVADLGLRAGTVLDLEPLYVNIDVTAPDRVVRAVRRRPRDDEDALREAVARATGVAVRRQVLVAPDGAPLVVAALREGDQVVVSILKIPVTVVERVGGSVLELAVEPTGAVAEVKRAVARERPEWEARRQRLRLRRGEEETDELSDDATAEDAGVTARTTLSLELVTDNIVFVDIKCGELFAVDRDEVLERGMLTLADEEDEEETQQKEENPTQKQENPTQKEETEEENPTQQEENPTQQKENPTPRPKQRVFREAVAPDDEEGRRKLLKLMMDCPTLGVNTQKVVTATPVAEYEIKEKEKISQMWGVQLKGYKRNKKGEEFLFVDPKTGSAGELLRQRFVEKGFLTPVPATDAEPEHVAERETNTMAYEGYVADVRGVFGVRSHADDRVR